LRKNPAIKKQQLSNLKAQLYRQILSSLRMIDEENIDIALHEQMDFARLLYNKGLYLQSLKVLDRMKEMASRQHQLTYLQQVLFFEKNIEALYITRSMKDRADQLSREADEVNESLVLVSKLSNLSLQLYSWYINHGHCRNREEEAEIKQFFNERLTVHPAGCKSFYEKLYLFQSYCWYAFIRQDFLMYYRYAQKWIDLFHDQPLMIKVETGYYIKGMHNLLNAHFDLRNFEGFAIALQQFRDFAATELAQKHDNHRVQTFVYINSAMINQHFMMGTFAEGLKLIPELEKKLEEYTHLLDNHRILVFNYKIANLYFGSGRYDIAIDYLQKIINEAPDLRNDLQCYARLLHLMAHYELGNYEILDSLTRSVYRFMAKMENLTIVEEAMFRFLRKSFQLSRHQMKAELKDFLDSIKQLEKNRFQTRTFAYLDVISWVESKVTGKPLSQVIHDKYLAKKKRLYPSVS